MMDSVTRWRNAIASTLGYVYSLSHYGNMISDAGRVEPYVQALRAALQPGAIALDLGCGIGFFAVLAAQLGASHVYAIEPDPAITVAQAIARDNGVSDRLTFLPAHASDIELPQRADVIISDLRGTLPLFQQHIPALIDARQRLLAPGGILIPQRDRLWASLIHAPKLYADCDQPWLGQPHGLDLSAARVYAVNRWRKCTFSTTQCLVAAQCWAVLDYATITSPHVRAELDWQLEQPGTAHGLGLWFDAELLNGIGFSNAPGQSERVYGKAFFPWLEPVALQAGDRVQVTLQANLVQDQYIWRWRSRVNRQEQAIADFQQSSFFAQPRSLAQFAARAPG
ncbi:MAG: methyltransferase domain-containing protein [Spirulinaceae cyanobacterium SM2_1_0]|nr:methyltransferase domain-containing protein [Spirulinaceae cyanobacterium SM2_1_0]